jgi:hypothetical protein
MPETRRGLSRRVAVNSLFLMIGSYFIGAHVLNFFGVSLPVVQVGGGCVVISLGWGMLMANDEVGEVTRRTVQSRDVFGRAFYPLTLPLTVGPGSISVAVTLGANSTHRYGFHVAVIVAAPRHGRGRREYRALLWICRPAGPIVRKNRYDGDYPALGVLAALYRRADHVERSQCAAFVCSASRSITTEIG